MLHRYIRKNSISFNISCELPKLKISGGVASSPRALRFEIWLITLSTFA